MNRHPFFLLFFSIFFVGCRTTIHVPTITTTAKIDDIAMKKTADVVNVISKPVVLEHKKNQRLITTKFNEYDMRYVQSKDPLLFKDSDKFTVDLQKYKKSGCVFPLPNARVISKYGTRNGRPHTGIDLKHQPKDTIYSVFDGVVRISRRISTYGNIIVVRHYNGLETVYSHNVKNLVKSGDRVNAGSPISIVGRTGRASTEHLHFETRANGVVFDPNLLFDFQKRELKRGKLTIEQTKKKGIRVSGH